FSLRSHTLTYIHSFPTRRSSDLLLSQSLLVMQATLAFDKAKRCYQIEEQISQAEAEFLSTHVQHFSLIAANEKIANQIRRLKSGDRKSTRLNSSHVKISYAVFCL